MASNVPGPSTGVEPPADNNAANDAAVRAGAGAPAGTAVNEGVAQSDFARDTGTGSLTEFFQDYVRRVRGGEVGALPALAGLIVLVVIFSQASDVFLSKGNLANLPAQAAGFGFIGMGLVFVLLLGEIDLSAGTASGVCAGTMAIVLNNDGNMRHSVGTPTWLVVLLLMVVAAGVAAWSRLWPAVVIIALGVVVLVAQLGSSAILAVYLAVSVGVAIGVLTGLLVSQVGIPSFVVTLALFLGWQGVLLQFIQNGAAIPTRNFGFINGIANKNVPPVLGWVLFLLAIGSYAALTITRSVRRRAAGLSAEPLSVVLARAGALLVIGIAAVLFLNAERSPNPKVISIKGMPWVVPAILVIMVFWTFVLSRTSFGRHIYAVGGNAEAARRAGIDVRRMRTAAFAISSGMAAIGGVVIASKTGGVPADAGGGNTLLYSVGAAVIGGTSLFGGRGRVRDAVIGALVIGMIPNGLGLLNLNSSYNFMITGVVLLMAATVDAVSRKKASATG
ncbi:D-xylose transport system permease protein [Motilibacter rhizosphaerae]|uniref:Xylose transport system permease protein XylH n=1 Tax=Motilibacter rhizosphaerae TaxID=598652 RepID=A0A4Q7NT15_9ACTN|nr:ABC transporter permease [Motilibacter rhizosphaerae]RZS89522.1 D-xylose transport system permease protein [Motilibacter rhizosphaerae]